MSDKLRWEEVAQSSKHQSYPEIIMGELEKKMHARGVVDVKYVGLVSSFKTIINRRSRS